MTAPGPAAESGLSWANSETLNNSRAVTEKIFNMVSDLGVLSGLLYPGLRESGCNGQAAHYKRLAAELLSTLASERGRQQGFNAFTQVLAVDQV